MCSRSALGHQPQPRQDDATEKGPAPIDQIHRDRRPRIDDGRRMSRLPPTVDSHGVEQTIDAHLLRLRHLHLQR